MVSMYYGSPEPEKPPRWWEETWVLSRAVFGVLFWPMAVLFLGLFALLGVFYLFSWHPLAGLGGIVAIGGAIWLFAWWDQRRGPPPDFTQRPR